MAKSFIYKNDTTCLLNGFQDNTTYYVKVLVYNSSSYSESNEVSFTTAICTCGVFTGEKKSGMVLIPAGCFNGKDTSIAAISYNFYIDTTEVTEDEWNRVINAADMDTSQITKEEWGILLNVDTSTSIKPKTEISWYQIILYCNEKSKQAKVDSCYSYSLVDVDTEMVKIVDIIDLECDFTKDGYRLPTEDEWEYAYRAGRSEEYYWGKDGNTSTVYPYTATYPNTLEDTLQVCEYAWWNYNNNPDGPKEVALMKSNAWRLYDMAGNVEEIVWDLFSYTREKLRIDYTGPAKSPQIVGMIRRGGGYKSLKPYYLTAWRRTAWMQPDDDSKTGVGFRTVSTKLL